MAIAIAVTQEHIDKGMQGSCRRCPVALAILDADRSTLAKEGLADYAGEITVAVWNTMVMFRSNWGEVRTYLPMNARGFVKSFDTNSATGTKPEPFQFTLKG